MCHDPTLGESRVGCLHPTRRFTRVVCLDESALRCKAPDRRLNDAELAALRRLATLVAGGVSPDECFAAVATEMANCLGVDKAEVFRSEDDGAVIAVACHVSPGIAHIAIGERITADDHKIATELLRTGFASTIDRHASAPGSVRARSTWSPVSVASSLPATRAFWRHGKLGGARCRKGSRRWLTWPTTQGSPHGPSGWKPTRCNDHGPSVSRSHHGNVRFGVVALRRPRSEHSDI
jgi:hypothetical protein